MGFPVTCFQAKFRKKNPKKITLRIRTRYDHHVALAGLGSLLFKYIKIIGKKREAKLDMLAEIMISSVGKAKWIKMAIKIASPIM
jgi:hypothetical protein